MSQPLASLDPNVAMSKVGQDSGGTATAKAPGAGQKRRRERSQDNDMAIDPSSIRLPGEYEGEVQIDQSCNQIRSKIRRFLESGEMKVTEFLREIHVNSNSYGRFMKLKGPYAGDGNSTYEAAYIFFKKRKLAGKKISAKKSKLSAEDASKWDVSDIHLEGEEDETVEIYDSCDEIRRKINAHLRRAGITRAAFLRTIGQMYPEPRKLQSTQLNTFLQFNGPTRGSEGSIYYAAYVYFEKLRIKNKEPKTSHREGMEDAWAVDGGAKHGKEAASYNRTGYICFKDSIPVMDQYGRVGIEHKTGLGRRRR
ncbi:MAG: hypothetical protein M1834_002693 [Cirrosporium novae-zelandiae]|nr:MAG: hypothetical protein M1834_002693 [Cirrosporium novae-zelandiae]